MGLWFQDVSGQSPSRTSPSCGSVSEFQNRTYCWFNKKTVAVQIPGTVPERPQFSDNQGFQRISPTALRSPSTVNSPSLWESSVAFQAGKPRNMCGGLSIKRIIPLLSFLPESSRAMNLHFDTNKPSPPRVAMMNRDVSNPGIRQQRTHTVKCMLECLQWLYVDLHGRFPPKEPLQNLEMSETWGTEIIGHTLNGTVQRLQNHSLPGNTWTLTNSRPFSLASTWSGIPVETWVNCPTWICMTPTNPNWCEPSFVPPSKTPRVTAAEAGRSITVCNSGCGAPNFCGCICEKFQRQRVHRKFAHQLWSPGSALFNKTM